MNNVTLEMERVIVYSLVTNLRHVHQLIMSLFTFLMHMICLGSYLNKLHTKRKELYIMNCTENGWQGNKRV